MQTCSFEQITYLMRLFIMQERAGVKMVMIQDGPQNTGADKPLRISGEPFKVQVSCHQLHTFSYLFIVFLLLRQMLFFIYRKGRSTFFLLIIIAPGAFL